MKSVIELVLNGRQYIRILPIVEIDAMLFGSERRKKRPIMRMLIIVVVERNPGGWSAWFRNSPHEICEGEFDILAILSLIERHGTADIDAWDMTRLDARSRDGHEEFLLPCAVCRPTRNRQDATN